MEQSRQKAFEMKEELVLKNETGELCSQDMSTFLTYLSNITDGPSSTEEEIIDELRIAIKGVDADGEPATLDRMACSKEAFCILMICDCLKKEGLQLIRADNWPSFSVNYTKYLIEI